MCPQIVELKHAKIETAKPEAKKTLDAGKFQVPRLSIDIINNRWRAFSKHGTMLQLDPEIEQVVHAALEAILRTDIIVDQRDIYYSIRMGHPDWTLAGHELKSEEAYNMFVGAVMEKLQLSTGFTMQSLGVRAGPRGYITGDETSYFILPDGKRIPVSASPVIQFNLVDEGVQLRTQCRKIIHYEKAAGMNSLIINDIPTMIEALFMTSQGYNVEAATKMHADMEKRGLQLYVLGDADPHGMSIQLMYGRASKSNAYMPDAFYPKTAVLLGLFPRIAKALSLPPEHVTDVHMRVVPNLKKLMQETRPDMLPDAEIIEEFREQWEWQSLNGLDTLAPAIYLIESLRASGDEIKYVPEAAIIKQTLQQVIAESVNEFVDEEIDSFALTWLKENLKPDLVRQLKEDLAEDIEELKGQIKEELTKLDEMNAEDLREAIKLKLVKNPKQYWTDGLRKVVGDMLTEQFDITSDVVGSVNTQRSSSVEKEVSITNPEVPEQPLTKDDIIDSIEKRVTGKKGLIQKIREAIESVFGQPDQTW